MEGLKGPLGGGDRGLGGLDPGGVDPGTLGTAGGGGGGGRRGGDDGVLGGEDGVLGGDDGVRGGDLTGVVGAGVGLGVAGGTGVEPYSIMKEAELSSLLGLVT